MIKENEITFVITCFNSEKIIKNTLENIPQVSKKIIIENSGNIKLKELENEFENLTSLIMKENLGYGAANNIGIKNSKGKFICFLDADDIWKKNKLLFQINFMIKKKSHISHTTYEIRNLKNNITGVRKAKNFSHYKELLPSCDIGLSTVVAEKKIFNKNIRFSKQKTKEDFVLWLKILKKNIKIIGINKNLASWHYTENSLSSSSIQKIKDAFLVYFQHMNFNLIKSIYYTLVLSINFMKKKFTDK